ncbi:hypothetical protein pb186bvf_013034 [Paramecium bursaria]
MHLEDFFQQLLGIQEEKKQVPTQQESTLTVQQIKMKQEILQKLNSPAYLLMEARKTNQNLEEIISNLNQQFEKYSHLQLVDIVQHPPVLEDRDSDYEDVEEQQEEQESYEDSQDDENEELSYQDDSQINDQIADIIEEEQEPQQQNVLDDDDDDEDLLQFDTYIENN